MNKCNVFLAGAKEWYINNTTTEYHIAWRNLAEEWIRKFGDNMKAINPCNYYIYDNNYYKSEHEIRRFLLNKIDHCDVVLVNLDHIKDSVNTLNEMFFAESRNIPIIGVYEWGKDEDYGDDRYKTEPWILDACLRIEDDEVSALTDALIYINNYYAS